MVPQGFLPVIQVMVPDGHDVVLKLVHQDSQGFAPFFPVVHIGVAHEIISGIHQQHVRVFGAVLFYQRGQFGEFFQIAVHIAGGNDDQRFVGIRFELLSQGERAQACQAGKENAGRNHGWRK